MTVGELKRLAREGGGAAALRPGERIPENEVPGCSARAWVAADLRPGAAGPELEVRADSDAELTRGLLRLLAAEVSGRSPGEVLGLGQDWLEGLGVGPTLLGPAGGRGRAQGLASALAAVQARSRVLSGGAGSAFPALKVRASGVEALGALAEAQARFLEPDAGRVAELADLLARGRVGIVSHFYMDPEVQGVLSAVAERWEHVFVSDSLVMADAAVRMARAGCRAVCVLGVDFMSENVRAILDEAGFEHVSVYRMAEQEIGCTLAEAAEAPAYEAYLARAAACGAPSLHVVYINTSLGTKARADAAVPTITCTSSNVVSTVLQAAAQVPDLHIWFGPDTNMGQNLASLLATLAAGPDEDVRALHPAHDAASVRGLLGRFHYFDDGVCSVHEMFGGEVARRVGEGYGDAFLTAHLEVPGEMFELAAKAQRERGMGVVGSTQNILDFVRGKTQEAVAAGRAGTLRFVLGTEMGMVTPLVAAVQEDLAGAAGELDVDIVFPVSSEAATPVDRAVPPPSSDGGGANAEVLRLMEGAGVAVLPGVQQGEGCGIDGGCANCPYMKMNSLAALLGLLRRVVADDAGPLHGEEVGVAGLLGFEARRHTELVGGKSIGEAGCESILCMRDFQRDKALPDRLVARVVAMGSPEGKAAPVAR